MGLKPTNATAAPDLQFTEITVPGGITPSVFAINNQGTTVGNCCLPDSPTTIFGWIDRQGVFTDVVIPGAGSDPNPFFGLNWLGELNSINDAGTDVGSYTDAHSRSHNFLRSPTGEITLLPDPTSYDTCQLEGINDAGVLVGYAAASLDAVTTGVGLHGLLWHHGKYAQIDYPGALGTYCSAINDEGQIVGWYVDASQDTHGFLLDGDRFRPFDVPDAVSTSPFGINNQGQIVGRYVDASQAQHGFLLSHGVYTTVDFPGQTGNELYGINGHGEMVGNYNYESNAFLLTIVQQEGE
jgi:probable HAF family extracellular repeat protein